MNDIPATSSLVHNFSPTLGVFSLLAVTTLITPGGTPASAAVSASNNAESGVSSAGLIIQVQPLAIAAAAFLAIIAVGKFHYLALSKLKANMVIYAKGYLSNMTSLFEGRLTGVSIPITPIGSRTSSIDLDGIGLLRTSPLFPNPKSEDK